MNAKNNAYTIVSVVFFLPYAFFQPPATVAIREIGPRRFLAAIVLFWGATMIVSSSSSSLTSLLNCQGLWLRKELADYGGTPSHSRCPRSRLLSWMHLSAQYMVSTLPTPET